MSAPEHQSNEILAEIRDSISPDRVREQVETICRSDPFQGQRNPQKILRYLFAEAVKGNAPTPEQLARNGLGKPDFGPGDSQPRQEVRKLRGLLKQYYDQKSKVDEIYLYIPERQYSLFWKHSEQTLLGQTETGGWVLRAAKLNAEGEARALETSKNFWPHLVSVYAVYCHESFRATLHNGKIELPEPVRQFFDSIGNCHIYVTSPDRSQIRIYPLNVWLAEWARSKRSEDVSDHLNLTALEVWGSSSQIENKSVISVPAKLLKELNVPDRFGITLCFHPDGFLYFESPEPLHRPVGRCNLYFLNYQPEQGTKIYYCLLVDTQKEDEFLAALRGTEKFNLKSYGYIADSGRGDPPANLKERMLAKYEAILAKSPSPDS